MPKLKRQKNVYLDEKELKLLHEAITSQAMRGVKNPSTRTVLLSGIQWETKESSNNGTQIS